MLGAAVEHIRDSTARRDSIDSDLLVTTVLGQDAHKRINGAFRARVKRMLWDTEILGRV